MKVIKVIPLSSGIPREYLSYFTAKDVTPGMLVTVPIRKKMYDAIVVSTEEASTEKADLKKALFNVKRIGAVKGAPFWRDEFTEAIKKTTSYFASGLGPGLAMLLPAVLLKNYSKIKTKPIEVSDGKVELKIKNEKLAFQGSFEDRIGFYKTFIREAFAKKRSVFIVLPTISLIEKFTETLSRGIEDYTFALHSELAPKKSLSTFNNAINEPHPVLIIATGSYLCLPRMDLGTIIVEEESKSAYIMQSRPYIDIRTFAEIYATVLGIKFITADTALRPESIYRTETAELGEVAPLSFRVQLAPTEEIVDMKAEPKPIKKKAYSFLSARAMFELEESIAKNERSIIFTLRKGLAPVTVCNDCGTTLSCDYCETPLVLYPGADERVYICNKCKREKTSKTTCKVCGSWNLAALGVASDGVEAELKERLPHAQIFTLTKDDAKNADEAKRIIKNFEKTPGAILIGTEFALFYLREKVRTVIIASFDSLFSIPSFRINEKVVQLTIMLRSLADRVMLIQTKNPKEKVLEALESGNLINLYREEIRERRAFGYPPFANIIKITCRGSMEDIEAQTKKLGTIFADYKPDTFDAFVKKVNNIYISHVVIKIDPAYWTLPELSGKGSLDPVLLQKLHSLPPFITVQVNPEDLL